jgi:hypothetical protein
MRGGVDGLQLRLEGCEPSGGGGACGVKLGEAGVLLFDRPAEVIVPSQRPSLSFRRKSPTPSSV